MRSRWTKSAAALTLLLPLTAHAEPSAIGRAATARRPAESLLPFGRGTPVQITASKQQVRVYVARARADGERPTDYDFVKVGMTPLVFELPPGGYYVEVENDTVTRGHLALRVGQRKQFVQVHTGSSSMGDLSTLALGIGIACVLAATVILVSTSSGPSGIQKSKFTIPLYASGGALSVGGLALYFASRTNLEAEPQASAALRAVPSERPRALLAGLRFAF